MFDDFGIYIFIALIIWIYFLTLGFLCRHKGAVAIRQPYIRVVGIEEANEADSRCPAYFTADEVIVELVEFHVINV